MARGKTVDLSAVEVKLTDDEVQAKPRGGGGKPFTPVQSILDGLLQTYNEGGSAVLPPIPAENIGSARSQVKRHADSLTPPLSVKFEEVENEDGSVSLKFSGQEKRPYKAREKESVDA